MGLRREKLAKGAAPDAPEKSQSAAAEIPTTKPPDVPAAATGTPGDVVELRALEYSSSGQLTGCGLTFMLLSEDRKQANGIMMLGGSLNTFYAEGKLPAWILKVFGNDMRVAPSGDVTTTPFQIHHAYLTGMEMTTAGKQAGTFECKDPQSFCIGFAGEEYFSVAKAILDDNLRVAYRRQQGEPDRLSPPLSFAQSANGSTEEKKVIDCLLRLAAKAEERHSPTKTPHQEGYEWASRNRASRFSDCQKQFGTSEAENGCNAYVQEVLYSGKGCGLDMM